jgi:hypothetical protein
MLQTRTQLADEDLELLGGAHCRDVFPHFAGSALLEVLHPPGCPNADREEKNADWDHGNGQPLK